MLTGHFCTRVAVAMTGICTCDPCLRIMSLRPEKHVRNGDVRAGVSSGEGTVPMSVSRAVLELCKMLQGLSLLFF